MQSELVIPDAGPQGTDVQVGVNTANIEDLQRLTRNQTFILMLVAAVLPTVGTIVVAIMQSRTRSELHELHNSVNGKMDQMLATASREGRAEGAATERGRKVAKKRK